MKPVFEGMFSEQLLRLIGSARAVAVLTGAGMSAESGVPTFRDPDGLWARFRPEELANFDAFMRNPVLVWEWYRHRREVIAAVSPHAGHEALAALEALIPDFTLITQNVDTLHARADSRDPIELHGNIARSYCIRCGGRNDDPEPGPDGAPTCACGGRVRPDVVWFGEMLPDAAVRRAWAAAERSELFLVIGTSAEVQPAAQLPLVAREHGGWTVEINPNDTVISHRMHECIRASAAAALPPLLAEARRRRSLA